MDKPEFTKWLKDVKGFTHATSKDVKSRFKRAQAISPLDPKSSIEDNLYKLSRCEEFNALSASVKSQLKRAVRLHFEYSFE